MTMAIAMTMTMTMTMTMAMAMVIWLSALLGKISWTGKATQSRSPTQIADCTTPTLSSYDQDDDYNYFL